MTNIKTIKKWLQKEREERWRIEEAIYDYLLVDPNKIERRINSLIEKGIDAEVIWNYFYKINASSYEQFKAVLKALTKHGWNIDDDTLKIILDLRNPNFIEEIFDFLGPNNIDINFYDDELQEFLQQKAHPSKAVAGFLTRMLEYYGQERDAYGFKLIAALLYGDGDWTGFLVEYDRKEIVVEKYAGGLEAFEKDCIVQHIDCGSDSYERQQAKEYGWNNLYGWLDDEYERFHAFDNI